MKKLLMKRLQAENQVNSQVKQIYKVIVVVIFVTRHRCCKLYIN